MALETKYGITVFEIPEDEPIILFRAQDVTLPQLLDTYSDLCNTARSPDSHIHAIEELRKRVLDWQLNNVDKVKAPD